MRCVSLLPSATEVIKEVAAYCVSPDDLQLIGRSHECDFPPEVESLPALTASKIKVRAAGGHVCGGTKLGDGHTPCSAVLLCSCRDRAQRGMAGECRPFCRPLHVDT